MASAQSYPNSTPVLSTDRFLGTDSNTTTKNFLASDVKDFCAPSEVNTSTLNNYTYSIRDENNTMVYSAVSGVASWTVPPNASVEFAIGSSILTCNASSDILTLVAGAAVTINGTLTIAAGQSKTLKKTDTNVWFAY